MRIYVAQFFENSGSFDLFELACMFYCNLVEPFAEPEFSPLPHPAYSAATDDVDVAISKGVYH